MRIIVLGAMGEVGISVSRALLAQGHEVVPVSARAPLGSEPGVLSLPEAMEAISRVDAELVLNCSGRGDRRASERSGVDATDYLAETIAASGIPGVLLSTTRVLEGYSEDYSESSEPQATTPYALANAENEARWLAHGALRMHVLRITNYFCAPQTVESPQAQLLPWSLATEALEKGSIGIRSGPSLTKEFVSAADVTRAVTMIGGDSSAPLVCATVPGAPLSLRALAEACVTALERVGRGGVDVTFGLDQPPGASCLPGWLASTGWRGELTANLITDEVTAWLLREGMGASGA
jgi:nucleoside-diphosphate-sugar epimerase